MLFPYKFKVHGEQILIFVVPFADEAQQNVLLASHRKCDFQVGNMGVKVHSRVGLVGARPLQRSCSSCGRGGVKMAPALPSVLPFLCRVDSWEACTLSDRLLLINEP